jgi:hypothetical protein
MPIVSNLELMRIEPRLFTDAADSGLTLLSATDGVISDNVLTSAASDFVATGVSTQDVVVVTGEAIEILSVDDATTLSTSRRRMSDASPVLKPGPGSGLSLSVVSFGPLLERVENQLLASVGIAPDHPTTPLTLADVINQDDLKPVIGMRVAASAFARAAAVTPTDDALAALAALYREIAEEATRMTPILIDTNGDGVADLSRRLSGLTLNRT